MSNIFDLLDMDRDALELYQHGDELRPDMTGLKQLVSKKLADLAVEKNYDKRTELSTLYRSIRKPNLDLAILKTLCGKEKNIIDLLDISKDRLKQINYIEGQLRPNMQELPELVTARLRVLEKSSPDKYKDLLYHYRYIQSGHEDKLHKDIENSLPEDFHLEFYRSNSDNPDDVSQKEPDSSSESSSDSSEINEEQELLISDNQLKKIDNLITQLEREVRKPLVINKGLKREEIGALNDLKNECTLGGVRLEEAIGIVESRYPRVCQGSNNSRTNALLEELKLESASPRP